MAPKDMIDPELTAVVATLAACPRIPRSRSTAGHFRHPSDRRP
ncbi:hypothetical protein [Nocardia sp. NBC_01327]|nr:hypothetical protein OG326_16095 [Nocardia sp. NBC_01327]